MAKKKSKRAGFYKLFFGVAVFLFLFLAGQQVLAGACNDSPTANKNDCTISITYEDPGGSGLAECKYKALSHSEPSACETADPTGWPSASDNPATPSVETCSGSGPVTLVTAPINEPLGDDDVCWYAKDNAGNKKQGVYKRIKIFSCDSSSCLAFPPTQAKCDFGGGGSADKMCGNNQYYKITVLASQICDLTWILDSINGYADINADYDLYADWDKDPVTFGYECSSTLGAGQQDSCSQSGLGTGNYYAKVEEYRKGYYKITGTLICRSFTISASPTTIKAPKTGTSESSTITITSINSFSSAVTLSVSAGLPAGATANFSPNPVTSPANGTVTSTFSVTTSNVAVGFFALTIQGKDGGITKTTPITLEVVDNPPTALVSLSPAEVNVIGQPNDVLSINISGSTDDIGISQVRFSSDDSQDGNLTGTWTGWYDWNTSNLAEGWNATTKIKTWGFASCGKKEVWAEVKDGSNQTDQEKANTTVNCSPTVNAGPDKTIFETQSTTLEGSGSDTDGTISYSWSCTGGTLSSTTVAQPTYTAPSVAADTNYTCTLTVADNDSASHSDSMIVTVQNVPPPAAPSNLTGSAVCASFNNPDINLSWTDNSNNEDGFKLYRGTAAGFTPTDPPLATLSANTTSYTDTTLSASTTYYYKIKSYNVGGDSSYASSSGITTDSCAPTFVLTPASASILVGQTKQFDGEYDSDGPGGGAAPVIVARTSVTWSSSNTAIATINTSGLATGVAVGSVTISGIYSGIAATASLTIGALPDTIIGSGPPSPTNSTSATFTFSGTESPTSYQCKLDSGNWDDCFSGQIIYSPVSQGQHTFQVKAWNAFGQDLTPASYTWLVDTTKPEIHAFDVAPKIPAWVNASTQNVAVSFEVSDAGESSLKDVEVWRENPTGHTPVGWNKIGTVLASNLSLKQESATNYLGSFQDPASNLLDGKTYLYGIHVNDNAGNMRTEDDNVPADPYTGGPLSAQVDKTAPTVPGTPFTTTPTRDTTPSWSWTASAGSPTLYTVYWDTTAGGMANSASVDTNSFTHLTALAQGTWHAKAKAFDAAGNASAFSNNGSVIIDTTAPTLNSFTVNNTAYLNEVLTNTNRVLNWTVSDNTGGSGLRQIEVWRAADSNSDGQPDGSEWGTAAIYTTSAPIETTYTDSAALADGTYWYGLHISDQVGNCITEKGERCPGDTGSDSLTRTAKGPIKVIIDKTAPSKPTCSPVAGNYADSVVVTCTSPESGAIIRYTTDETSPTTASTQYTSALTFTLTTTLTAAAWDGAGNRSGDNVYTYTIMSQDCLDLFNFIKNGSVSSCTGNTTKYIGNIKGDVNNDKYINTTDFSSFAAYFQEANWCQTQLDDETNPCNKPPTISSVSDSPDPIKADADINFSVTWSDPDANDQTKIHICKTDAIFGQVCSGDFWCETTSFSNTSPTSCSYLTTTDAGTKNYYAFVCDDDNACSAVCPTGDSKCSGDFLVDAEKPQIVAFDVSPKTPQWVNQNNPNVAISWTVSDSGGSYLQHVNVWRAVFDNTDPDGDGKRCDDDNKEDCVWNPVESNVEAPPNSNSWKCSDTGNCIVDRSPSDGVYWYGIHVLDKAGNETTEGESTDPKAGLKFSVIKVIVDKDPPSSSIESPINIWLLKTTSNNHYYMRTADEDLGGSQLNTNECKYQFCSYQDKNGDGKGDVSEEECSVSLLRPCNITTNELEIFVGDASKCSNSAGWKGCCFEAKEACTIFVSAKDGASNIGESSQNYNIDWTFPTVGKIYITDNPPPKIDDPTYKIQIKEGVTYTFKTHVTDNLSIDQAKGCDLFIDGIKEGNMSLPETCTTDCVATRDVRIMDSGIFTNNYAICWDKAGNGKQGNSVSSIEVEENHFPDINPLGPDKDYPKYTFSPCSSITTQPGCNVNFSVSASDVDADPLTYSWDFGDGQTSTQQNPPHDYDTPGVYNVKVTVSDGRGGTDSGSKEVTVTAPTLEMSLCAGTNADTFCNNPYSGVYPLDGVDFRTAVSGTMFGTIRYYFDCDITTNDCMADYGTVGWSADCDYETPAIDTNPYTTLDLCDYPAAGSYTAKTFIERGTGSAQDAAAITVIENQAPTAVNLTVTPGDYCFALYPPIHLSWQFSDPNPGDFQSAYRVQVDNNSDFNSPEIDFGKVVSSSNSYAPIGLLYNTTYYWRVKLWDSYDVASNWATGTSFTTVPHPYPEPDFSWTPQSPGVNELIQFTNKTTYYNSNGTWNWNFGDATPASTQQNPTHVYSNSGLYSVTLQVIDGSGFGPCSISRQMTISFPLPEWEEISPF